MKNSKRIEFRNAVMRRSTGFAMIAIILIMGLRAPLFFAPANLMTVLKQSGILCMTAISITSVLIVGGLTWGRAPWCSWCATWRQE